MNLSDAIAQWNHLAATWLDHAAFGIATVLLLGAVCTVLDRFLSPLLRCWLWWLLCVRLVTAAGGGLIGLPELPIPVALALPAAIRNPVQPAASDEPATIETVGAKMHVEPRTRLMTPSATVTIPRPTAAAYFLLLWAGGVLTSIIIVAREAQRVRRTLNGARDLSASPLGAEMRELAVRMGVAALPRLIEVDGASSPFITGLRQPVLVVPSGLATALSPDEARMAIAHELAHLRRGDLYLALIPMAVRVLFFCIPFLPARICAEWATAREADCDSRAMRATDASPGVYSRVLIKIVRSDATAHRARIFALGATASFHTLHERLQIIRGGAPESRRSTALWIPLFALLALLAIVPWRVVKSSKTARFGSDAPLVPLATPPGAEDVADVPAFDTFAEGDPAKRYLLIGARPEAVAPAEGYRLLIVLPGGDGGVDFNCFVRRLQKQTLGKHYLVAELIAKRWDSRQFSELVWPTQTNAWPTMRFSTEEFASSVVRDVEARFPVDRRQIFSLSWASGGPAGYALSLSPQTPVSGSIVAMSMFDTSALPSLSAARGQRTIFCTRTTHRLSRHMSPKTLRLSCGKTAPPSSLRPTPAATDGPATCTIRYAEAFAIWRTKTDIDQVRPMELSAQSRSKATDSKGCKPNENR